MSHRDDICGHRLRDKRYTLRIQQGDDVVGVVGRGTKILLSDPRSELRLIKGKEKEQMPI